MILEIAALCLGFLGLTLGVLALRRAQRFLDRQEGKRCPHCLHFMKIQHGKAKCLDCGWIADRYQLMRKAGSKRRRG